MYSWRTPARPATSTAAPPTATSAAWRAVGDPHRRRAKHQQPQRGRDPRLGRQPRHVRHDIGRQADRQARGGRQHPAPAAQQRQHPDDHADGQLERPAAAAGAVGDDGGVGGEDDAEQQAQADADHGRGPGGEAVRPVHWPQGTQPAAGRESAEGTILARAEPYFAPMPGGRARPEAGPVTTSLAPLIIETRGLTKRFGSRTAVADVDLTVPAGCAFGFLGHNGAGKTTVIRLLTGLTQPDSGTIRVGGRPLAGHRAEVLARVGAIIEEPRFHHHLTGRENLQVIAAVRGPQAGRRIEPALERVGLADRAGDRVGGYSQGMRQRLGIARCLLADPRLIILDEPMNGLDPGGILELRGLIADLVAEGRTVFISSHLIDEIEKTCHAAAVIDRGRLIAQGPIAALLGDGGSSLEDWFLTLTSRIGARS